MAASSENKQLKQRQQIIHTNLESDTTQRGVVFAAVFTVSVNILSSHCLCLLYGKVYLGL